MDIENYQDKFILHDDPLCESAKKGGKDRRTRTSLALIVPRATILFDAGPDIKYQLKKYQLKKPKAVFITHEHADASYGLRYLKNIKVFSEKAGNLKVGRSIKIFDAEILPFRVVHSKIAPYTGYQLKIKNKNIVYATDLASLRGVKAYFQNTDILFADGSIFKRDLAGHLSIVQQLKFYCRWKLKRVIFIHFGHAILPHKELNTLVKNLYPNAEIGCDGLILRF